MAGETKDWNRLPYHILVDICSYLKVQDRNSFARVCKDFDEILDCKHLWRKFKFRLSTAEDARFVKCLEKYGQHMYHIDVELDQYLPENRQNALQILNYLCTMKELRLKHLSLKFKGGNPCFYSGKEFIDALVQLLGPPRDSQVRIFNLVDLDLGELLVSLDSKFLDVISENNPHLQKLNIQNSRVLVCNITPQSALRLAERCRALSDLYLFNHSLTDEVLLEFAKRDRTPLRHLSVLNRGRGPTKPITSPTWQAVIEHNPQLKVALLFDHTCSTDLVAETMKPETPVYKLVMETYTYIYDEVNQASRCYGRTLESFILHTPISRNSPELHSALIRLAKECILLEEMHVYCVLDLPTVEKILDLRPKMKEKGTYTLRHKSWSIDAPSSPAPAPQGSDVC